MAFCTRSQILLDIPDIKKSGFTIQDIYGHEQAHVRFLLQVIRANEKDIEETANKYTDRCVYESLEDCEETVMDQLRRRLQKKMEKMYTQGVWHQGDNDPGQWPKEIPIPKTDPRPPVMTPVPPSAPPVDNGPYFHRSWAEDLTFTPSTVPKPEWPEGVEHSR